jgi:hypothetical protein
MLSLQLGNLYLLMAFVGIGILYYTTDPTIVRNYVIALALGDVGHLVTTYMGMGHEGFVDLTGWNGNGWGNIGATVCFLASFDAWLMLVGCPVRNTNGISFWTAGERSRKQSRTQSSSCQSCQKEGMKVPLSLLFIHEMGILMNQSHLIETGIGINAQTPFPSAVQSTVETPSATQGRIQI